MYKLLIASAISSAAHYTSVTFKLMTSSISYQPRNKNFQQLTDNYQPMTSMVAMIIKQKDLIDHIIILCSLHV